MGRRCCIRGCNSTSRLPEHHGVTYHSFPLDALVRALWIRHTQISSERNITKSVLVCSRHFRRADFQPQRSGKYLLKQRVFPTVFPWGKVDQMQVEADQEELAKAAVNAVGNVSLGGAVEEESGEESATKATVEATVAQIMAEAAELNAAANIKMETSETTEAGANISSPVPAGVKFEPVTNFNPGSRLEAQDFDGVWHTARVVEVDNDDREVLIKFERTGKIKSAIVGTEEWIPMNSNRLRQKVSTKPIPVFELEEKCLARWSGPRKFPGTVKKILPNDVYEVLFDDGYIKNVRAVHMNKMLSSVKPAVAMPEDKNSVDLSVSMPLMVQSEQGNATLPLTPTPNVVRSSPLPVAASSTKKRAAPGSRKDWPLLDMSKLDLASLNLPEIPKDGEWTCHWVNDQPIGREGFLIVGEHRKPTVIVEDWRLPPGWVKHMYQRSNVLGKWDVILVTPTQKRFRSKADLKNYLEEQGQYYNPDIYDFSIHRRRAKDINAYVYTADYTPQPAQKTKPLDSSIEAALNSPEGISTLASSSGSLPYLETPVASAVPPMELMTSPEGMKIETNIAEIPSGLGVNESLIDRVTSLDDGYAYIGGLKVQIIDNLFRCPQEGCFKNFRKENHLQIHIKHYHADLIKLLGDCPKMQELAEKRTHPTIADQSEPMPKNQIPNQEFFAKLHQQDLEHTRAHRRSAGTSAVTNPATEITAEIKDEPMEVKIENVDDSKMDISAVTTDMSHNNTTLNSSLMDMSTTSANESSLTDLSGVAPIKRSRFSPNKRHAGGSRKSNRQRTTRRYLTAAQATAALNMHALDSSNFGVSDFEETRHSFNATPDVKLIESRRHRKTSAAPATPLSSIDSPITADSGSSSMQACYGTEVEMAPISHKTNPQYIKENGELIKIVRMRQEEIINCLCSYGEEDGLMIQCELCLCWQHGICNGIDKESDVPDKYVCYICRNPQRGRDSLRFKHDQDWLFDGKLPTANYHLSNPELIKRFDFLKKSHTLTGNLIELKQFMHSLRVKINIANNRCHPKLYLWAKKWDDEASKQLELEVKLEEQDNKDEITIKNEKDTKKSMTLSPSPSKKIKTEPNTPRAPMPNIPMPEAPIDPVECQHRLLEHVKYQQCLVMNRLNDIEAEIDELERQDDDLPDLKEADLSTTKDILATFIKELNTLKQIAKLNALEHTKQAYQQQDQQQQQVPAK